MASWHRPVPSWVAVVLLAACHPAGARAPSGPPSSPPAREDRAPPTEPAGAPADPEVRVLVQRINQRRVAIGCQPLRWDARLAAVARRHSENMARNGFFGHEDRSGNDPFDRLRAAGISFRAAAENIAAGHRSGVEVYEDWMRSRGHRKNLENCVYTHHGIGLFQDHWTHVFATY